MHRTFRFTLLAALMAAAPAMAGTPSEAASSYRGPDTGLFTFELEFSSSSNAERTCAADIFSSRGQEKVAHVLRSASEGKNASINFSIAAPSIGSDTDKLVASLSSCQLGHNSKLTWWVGRHPK